MSKPTQEPQIAGTALTCSRCQAPQFIPEYILKRSPIKAGKWSLCEQCQEISLFGEDLQLRRPTDAEEQALMRDAKQYGDITRIREIMTRNFMPR